MRYLGIIFIVTFLIIINVGIVLVYKYERRPRKSECRKNLINIVSFMYNQEDSVFRLDRSAPDFPVKLLEYNKDSQKRKSSDLKKSFTCPFCNNRCKPGEFTYTGISAPAGIKDPREWAKEWPLLWDKPENHPDGVHVVRLNKKDSTPEVEFITHEAFYQLKAKLDAEIGKINTETNQK